MNESTYCTLSTTVDDETIADTIAQTLLEKKLVACVQKSTVKSLYRWNGKTEQTHEFLLQMKTKSIYFKRIETLIIKLHPYEIPEIIAVPIINANQPYLDWIEKELQE